MSVSKIKISPETKVKIVKGIKKYGKAAIVAVVSVVLKDMSEKE